MRISYGLILTFLTASAAFSADFMQADRDFETYKSSNDQQFESQKDEFERYKAEINKAFRQYKQKTAQIWGTKDRGLPTRKTDVTYLGDLNHRRIIDFEKGDITIQIALPDSRKKPDTKIRSDLTATIETSLQQGSDPRSIIDIAKDPAHAGKGPNLLKGLVASDNHQPLKQQDISKISELAANNAQKRTIKGADGKKRIVYTAHLKMVPDHIRRRAQPYLSLVNKHAAQHRIPTPLVLAIIENESMFNPNARSPVPAFGLMQLVPSSGAREGYRYVYKRDRVVSDTFLYNPDNNVLLGTAFMNRLYYRYLQGIKNPESRQWAMVAAYNTGAGNVFRSFAGQYSRSRFGNRSKWKETALREINRRSPEQVYTYLKHHLPYQETRTYMGKIRKSINKYKTT